jgi:hypothetical protein
VRVNPTGEDHSRGRLIESGGPWPFTTRRVFQHPDGTRRLWRSRHHRKGLRALEPWEPGAAGGTLWRCLWMPRELNWWIGIVFAIGSLLFALGSVLSLAPALAARWSLDAAAVNAIFFAGSIPFTTAAYLQLSQAANAGEPSARGPSPPPSVRAFGWRPGDIGWLSCALQFAGTLLFNVNTFDALLPGMDWLQEDLAVWAPDAVGSMLFLVSGYLAFIEACHAYWDWQPRSISWWVTFINLLGCVPFMVSAAFAFVSPEPPAFDAVTVSVAFTLVGAVAFFAGSLLMLPEAATSAKHALLSGDAAPA